MSVSKDILKALADCNGVALPDERAELLATQLDSVRQGLQLADELDLSEVEPAFIFIPVR